MKIPEVFVEKTLISKGLKYRHYPEKHTFQIFNPFIQDTDFHMGLNYKMQVFHCFKTGDKGSLESFFQKLLNIDEFTLMKRVKAHDFDPVAVPQVKDKKPIAPVSEPEHWHLIKNLRGQIQKIHFNYLLKRKITDEKIFRNKFFYSGKDLFRVIIPYYIKGKLVYWTARDITGKSEKKYLYPNEQECPNKNGDLVYNYDWCDKMHLIICEGQFNALVVDGIAVGGSNLSQMQLQLIRSLGPRKVTIAFDSDEPGKNAMLKTIKTLHRYFRNLWYVDAPITKEDFSDMGEQAAKEFIAKYSKEYNQANIFDTEMNFKLR